MKKGETEISQKNIRNFLRFKNKIISKIEKKKRKNLVDKGLLYSMKKFPGDLRKIFRNARSDILLIKNEGIYFAIPKVACTSLKGTFGKIGTKNLSDKNIHKFLKNKKYFKFAVTRNPYVRLYSCWRNKVKSPSTGEGVEGLYLGFYQYYPKIYPEMPFKEFVEVVSKIPDSSSEKHFRSQYTFITKNNKLIIDKTFKLEEFNKVGYKEVCKKINVKNPPKLSHRRKSKAPSYKSYYDSKTKELVKKRYKKDLELFGYQF